MKFILGAGLFFSYRTSSFLQEISNPALSFILPNPRGFFVCRMIFPVERPFLFSLKTLAFLLGFFLLAMRKDLSPGARFGTRTSLFNVPSRFFAKPPLFLLPPPPTIVTPIVKKDTFFFPQMEVSSFPGCSFLTLFFSNFLLSS